MRDPSFAVALLGEDHLPQRCFLQAIDGGDILALLRGLRALDIGEHIVQDRQNSRIF